MASTYATWIGDHIWQSTFVAGILYGLTRLLRNNHARIRSLIWQAASAKLLIPFSLLSAVGSYISSPLKSVAGQHHDVLSTISIGLTPVSSFGEHLAARVTDKTWFSAHSQSILISLCLLWCVGVALVAARWYTRWVVVRAALRQSTSTHMSFVVPVRLSYLQLEPAIVGIVHPVLLLPHGLQLRLTAKELEAILAHERCHVAWNDNLSAALHMLVEAIFWFFPLVWWIGAQLVDERERACDEQVLKDGVLPATYAEGILKVCDHYLDSRLACVAGIGTASLRQRIETIVGDSIVVDINAAQRLAITLAAFTTIVLPVCLGAVASPLGSVSVGRRHNSNIYLGPVREWELRSEVWLSMPEMTPKRPQH